MRSLSYRWLGVAGLEFTAQGYTLLIDPFFTRPGKADVIANRRVPSNAGLVARHISRADAVLVTHAHYDHLMDVPEVLRLTGASAYGSPNTCALLALHGIPSEKLHVIQVGDRLELGPFTVEVFPNAHTRIPFSRWFNGPLPSGYSSWKPPLRLNDYRMDACYGFRVTQEGRVLQVGKHPAPADVMFFSPYTTPAVLITLLRDVRPSLVVPIHWDDFMRPLNLPLLPMLATPAQGLRPLLPLVRRLDLHAFAHTVQQFLPDTRVQIPEIFEPYPLFD